MKTCGTVTKSSAFGIASAICLVGIFVVIASGVVRNGTLAWDVAVLFGINARSHDVADSIVLAVTHLGDIAVIILFTAIVTGLLMKRRQFFAIPYVLATIGGGIVLNVLLKAAFQRDRPELWTLLTHEATYSFPSGHALMTSAFAVLVIGLLWRTKWRAVSVVAGAMYVALIGFSRLYLGVHYPSDIAAGWCVGAAWAIVVLVAMRERQRRTG